MAKETAKKNWRRNAVRMKIFSYVTLAVNALYVCVIMYRNGGLPGFRDLVAIAFWAGQEYAAYAALNNFAKPTFGPEGELVDCPDASSPKELGYYSFVQDALWMSWVVQTLCNIHGAFIVFYLPVPATVIYKVWTLLLKPMLASRSGGAAGGDGQSAGQPARNRQERRREEREKRKTKK